MQPRWHALCLVLGQEEGRMDIRKILVPVDFSEHSQRALDEAIGLAKTFGAQLHLLHCYQIHPAAVAPYGIVVPETFEHDIRMAGAPSACRSGATKAARSGRPRAGAHHAHFPPRRSRRWRIISAST
jgi:nucleotide-binding universal stress UspA family protein